MILLSENRIVRGDVYERIVRWEVYWKTPWGLCKDTHEAVTKMKAAGFDPDVTLIPVAVAIGETTYETMER